MQKANDLVWAEKWQDAVKTYRRALAEFPNDLSALMGYAWALLNARELEEAEKIYRKLTELNPADPGPYERIAELLERRGETEEAAKIYYQAAERYGKQGLYSKQTASLEASVRLRPYNDRAWSALLQQYQEQANVDRSVLAALWLTYIYQDEHQEWAIEVCRQMQRFIPHDRRIAQTLMHLQSNQPLPEPPPLGEELPVPDIDTDELEEITSEQGNPVDIARQRALAKLAEALFDEDKPHVQGLSPMEVDMLIGKAVDAQTRGDLEEAQSSYEQLLDAGVSMPSIHFNLGMLYKEQMHFDEAISQFQKSLSDPEYVLGTHFALGECYQAQANFREGLKHYLEAVKIIDLSTVKRAQADDLIRVYEGLAQSLANTGEQERIQQLSQTLVDFLGQRGWEEEAVKARKRLDGLERAGTVLSLAELISLPGSDDILRSIALAQEYQRRKRIYRALEELLHTVGKAPDYLPLHHLLASLLIESGNIDEGVEKFEIIAQTYEIRGQTPQALATYQQILQLAPLEVAVHRRVAELLVQRGQIDDALDQYLEMADAFYQLAQPERAREVYNDALRMAPRGTQERQWELRILHRVADLDLQRLDWQSAIKDYEEIVRISPDDERGHLGLFRLYPRTGRPHLGISALDKLLKRYLETRKVNKALAVLEDLVKEQPDSLALRSRITQLYLNLEQRDKALEHLDVLGDLQLEAGNREGAAKTIEIILALRPTNYEAYADLYRELTGQAPPR